MPHRLIAMALAPRAGRPDAEAMVHGPRRFTWDELGDYVDRAAAVLRAHGVAPGAVVANQQGKAIEEVVAVLAAARLGATPLNLHPTLTAPQVADALQRSGARVLVLHRARVRPLASALAVAPLDLLVTIGQPLPPDCGFVPAGLAVQHLLDGVKTTDPLQDQPVSTAAPAALHLAPGLSGAPLEPWDADGLAMEAAALAKALGLTARSRLLSVIPFSTRAGLVSLLAGGHSGATTHLQRFLEPADVAAACAGEAITHLWLTPEQLDRLVSAPAVLAALGPVTVGVHGPVSDATRGAVAACAPQALLVAVPPPAAPGEAAWVDGLRIDPAVVMAPFAAVPATARWAWAPGAVAGRALTAQVAPSDPDLPLEDVLARLPVAWPACLRPAQVTLSR